MSRLTATRISRSQASKSYNRRAGSKRQKRQADSPVIHPLLQMQQILGNRAVGRMIQAQLKVNQPGDQYEQEADRVAEQVVNGQNSMTSKPTAISSSSQGSSMQRMPEVEDDKNELKKPDEMAVPAISRMAEGEEDLELKKKPAEGESEEEMPPTLQTKPTPNASPLVKPSVASNINRMQGGGKYLPKRVRAYFEPRMGADFSQVRVHTDSHAADTAKSINARAFTVGRNIAFVAGEYSPGTTSGRKLLAHELTHVIQQGAVNASTDGESFLVQRTIGDGHDLASPRFKGDTELEGCYDDEARLTMKGLGKPGTKKVESGPAVMKVQEALIELGYLKEGLADGHYTQATWDAVKALKKDKSLGWENMGDVGPGTMNWLDKNFLGGKVCPPCPSSEPRPSPCLPCPLILPVPPKPDVPPGPVKPPNSPSEFCVPFLTKQEAMMIHPAVILTMHTFTAKFGPEVQNLWMKYLFNPKSGTKGTLPPRQVFSNQQSRVVQEFRQDPETQKQKDRIMRLLADRVRSNPSLMPIPGQSTSLLDFRIVLNDAELLDLPMSFGDPGNKIPGLIAGGPAKGINASDAGDDVRNVDGKFIATNLGLSTLQIRAVFTFDVFDCVDFCPGAAGSRSAQALTIPVSKLEATPDVPTYDVPFEVIYGLSDEQSF